MEQNYERFGCCAFWYQCDNGGNCHYSQTAPNKMKACGMYLSQQIGEPTIVEHTGIFEKPAPSILEEKVVPVPEVETSQSQELVQLSLFTF